MPFASQPPAERVTSRDKRRIAAVVAAILLVLAAVAVWAAVRPGAYDSSKDGCITVTIPGTTGGQLIHQCGAGARSLCKRAYAGTDRGSALTRPQCRLAGITPSRASSSN
jgi:predicted small integral membrane protein